MVVGNHLPVILREILVLNDVIIVVDSSGRFRDGIMIVVGMPDKRNHAFLDWSMSEKQLSPLIINSVCFNAFLHPTPLALCSLIERAMTQGWAAKSLGFDKKLLEEAIASDTRKLSIPSLKCRVKLGT